MLLDEHGSVVEVGSFVSSISIKKGIVEDRLIIKVLEWVGPFNKLKNHKETLVYRLKYSVDLVEPEDLI